MRKATCRPMFAGALALVAGILVGELGKAAERPAQEGTGLTFSGLVWQPKSGTRLGPGPNDWGADLAWVDKEGRLHLRIAKDVAGKWRSAEVTSNKSFGYGEYRFTFSGSLNDLDPNIVLGLFTYLDDNNEIDFELGRWGRASEPKNAQFVVQPATDARMHRFATGKVSRLTCTLVWTPGRVQGNCCEGTGGPDAKPLASWTFTGSGVPVPSTEKLHLNLWLMRGETPKNLAPAEVVIESFEFRAWKSSP